MRLRNYSQRTERCCRESEKAHSVPVTSQGRPDQAPGKRMQIALGPPSNGLRFPILNDLASGDPGARSPASRTVGKADCTAESTGSTEASGLDSGWKSLHATGSLCGTGSWFLGTNFYNRHRRLLFHTLCALCVLWGDPFVVGSPGIWGVVASGREASRDGWVDQTPSGFGALGGLVPGLEDGIPTSNEVPRSPHHGPPKIRMSSRRAGRARKEFGDSNFVEALPTDLVGLP
jgi:hypothetical protein